MVENIYSVVARFSVIRGLISQNDVVFCHPEESAMKDLANAESDRNKYLYRSAMAELDSSRDAQNDGRTD